jgi:hypothetical protein
LRFSLQHHKRLLLKQSLSPSLNFHIFMVRLQIVDEDIVLSAPNHRTVFDVSARIWTQHAVVRDVRMRSISGVGGGIVGADPGRAV